MATIRFPDEGNFLIVGLPEGPRPAYSFHANGDLMVAQNVFPFSKAFVEAAEQIAHWDDSTLAAPGEGAVYTDRNRRSSTKLTLSQHPTLIPYNNSLVRVAQACMSIYQMRNPYANVSGAPVFELLRYMVGQQFEEHIDLIPGHPAWGRRRVSVLLYPNENYKGGEIVFPRQNLTLKPKTGSLILFPSDYTFPHASLPVTEGTKFSAVAWFS